MPDQTKLTPEQAQGLAGYLSPQPEPPPPVVPFTTQAAPVPFSTQGVQAPGYAAPPNFQAQDHAYAPPPNGPVESPAGLSRVFDLHPQRPQYAAPPDYEGPTLDEQDLARRTTEQRPGEEAPAEEPRMMMMEQSFPRVAWGPQQQHEARQLLPPPHRIGQPDAGIEDEDVYDEGKDAGAPGGAPIAKEKAKDEEKST